MFLTFASTNEPHVSLPAEELFTILGFPITNAMLTGVLASGLLIWAFMHAVKKIKAGERNRFATFLQWVFEGLYGTVEQVVGNKVLARKLAPLVITLFFFILFNYWFGILPVVGPITYDGVPVFRSLIADMNTTFALAIITIVAGQIYAVGVHGMGGNLGRYFRNPVKDPAGAFEGVLELIAEFSRLMGLSLRLFGNVFAGEILLMMIALLTVWVSPLSLPPFYIFELFIGAIQAYIFFMLSTVFISLGLASHGDGHSHSHDDHSHSTEDRALELAPRGDS